MWKFFRIPNVLNKFYGSQNLMYYLLLGSVPPKFDQYLEIYNFSGSQ